MMSRLLTRREQFVLGFLGVALLTGSIAVFAMRGAEPEPAPLVVESQSLGNLAPQTLDAPAPIKEVVVSVQGAVVKPGVYKVDEGTRVNDLIQAAGGLAPAADTSAINLAARVVDGTTLTVPVRTAPGASGQDSAPAPLINPDAYAIAGQAVPGVAHAGGSRLIRLNHATREELETLPGIGPKLAEQIIQYRSAQPFRDITDLLNVSGIGDAKLASVRDLVTVD